MNEALKETLFDLQQFGKAKICQNKKCGKEFIPRNKQQRKYCCENCKKVALRRKNEEKIKIQFQFIQHNNVPIPENLTGKDKKAVELYIKKNFGLGRIARELEESKSNVRRRLISVNAYKPKPSQNTLARKGTGKFSNVLKRERMKKREDDWRQRILVCLRNLRRGIKIEVTCKTEGWSSKGIWHRLKGKEMLMRWISSHAFEIENVSDHRQVRTLRHRIAVCLWNFYRYKTPIETFCHSKGWNPATIWNYVHRSKVYKKLKALRPSKPYNVQQYEYGRKNSWRSKTYATEGDFQDVIEGLLNKFTIKYVREKVLLSGKKVDFELNGSVCFECKISTKPTAFSRGIGQAVIYKAEKKDVWFVLPDDVKINEKQRKIFDQNNVEIFSETDFRTKLANGEIIQFLAKPTEVQKN